MATTPFQSFLNLIKFDQRFHQLSAQLRECKEESAHLQNELDMVNVREQEYKHRLHDARKTVDEQELTMKELTEAEKEKKERLERVSNQKEYAALKHEISQIQEQQQEYEGILLDAWNKVDNSQKEFKSEQVKAAEARTLLETDLTTKGSELSEITSEIEAFEKDREALLEGVPEEWVEKYNMMRERVIDPVVPVMRNSCGACFYAVAPQMLAALRAGKLLQCKDCYRLLYIEPDA